MNCKCELIINSTEQRIEKRKINLANPDYKMLGKKDIQTLIDGEIAWVEAIKEAHFRGEHNIWEE